MLDESEFLSPHGIRSISRAHKGSPFTIDLDGQTYRVDYEPGESRTTLFGGNSNWRGPVWMPINALLIGALQRFDSYYGADFRIECPTGSGHMLSLSEIASELSRRLTSLFLRDGTGVRPAMQASRLPRSGGEEGLLFHEYFHGETGEGLGASHQTGWTGMVALLIQETYAKRETPPA